MRVVINDKDICSIRSMEKFFRRADSRREGQRKRVPRFSLNFREHSVVPRE